MYTQGEAEEILYQWKLGFSFICLVPKERGVWPIVNLRRKKETQQVSKSLRLKFEGHQTIIKTDIQIQWAWTPIDKPDTSRGIPDPHLWKSMKQSSLNIDKQLRKQIKKCKPELMGASVFSSDEIYPKLKEFNGRIQLGKEKQMWVIF